MAAFKDLLLGLTTYPEPIAMSALDDAAAMSAALGARISAIACELTMRRIWIGTLALTIGAIVFADTGYAQKFDGKKAYVNLCASCHGMSGKGDGPVAPYLTQKPADLTKLAEGAAGGFSSERVYAVIDGRRDIRVHGTREMPVWGLASGVSPALYRARTRAIVDYLRTLQEK
jgi:cytochrome c553